MSAMTPREIVHELDTHIIGQQDAKLSILLPNNVCVQLMDDFSRCHS